MDQVCSCEGCRGSPKNSCSCNKSLTFCEFHIETHLKEPGSHSKRPLLNIEEALRGEMKNVSGAVKQLIMTGKEMFTEVCNKLVEITVNLTERQEALISIVY